MQATRPKAAVFIDFENIAIAAQDAHGFFSLDAVMAEAERWGTCGVRRAYADWTRFRAYGETVSEMCIRDSSECWPPSMSSAPWRP